jgi:hypothetical protein
MVRQLFDAERQILLPTLFVSRTRPAHRTPIRFGAFCSPSEPDRQAAAHCLAAPSRPWRTTASQISRLERLAIET